MAAHKGLSLKSKIALPVVLCVAVLVVLMTGFVTLKMRTASYNDALKLSEQIAYRHGFEVKTEIENALTIARAMAQGMAGQRKHGPLNRDHVNHQLRELLEQHPKFLGVWVGWEPDAFDGQDQRYASKPGHDATGRFVPYWNRGAGAIVVEALADYTKAGPGDYYQIPKATKQETLLEPYSYKVGGQDVLITSAAVPIIVDGKVLGVAGIDISLADLQKLADGIKPYGTGHVTILSGQGLLVTASEASLLGKEYKADLGEDAAIQAIVQKREFSQVEKAGRNGTESLQTFVPIYFGHYKTPWLFHVSVPTAEVMKTANTLLVVQTVGCALMLMILAAVIWFVASLISKPVYRAREMMQASVEEIGENSGALQGLSQRGASAATEQAAAIQQTVAALNEINAMVQKTLSSASESEMSASESHSVAKAGAQSVANMLSAIGRINDSNKSIIGQVQNSTDSLTGIVKLIEDIGEKTRVINDIVFQTKLLSFNASVEAARAGENGKGFAVVAEEVATLADMSGKASREITDLLTRSTETVNRIAQETRGQVDSITRTSREDLEHGSQIASECGQALEKIVETAAILTDKIKEITTASTEQARGVEEITKAMQQLDETTHTNAELSTQIADHARHLLDDANNLENSVRVLDQEVLGQAGSQTVETPQEIIPLSSTPRAFNKAA